MFPRAQPKPPQPRCSTSISCSFILKPGPFLLVLFNSKPVRIPHFLDSFHHFLFGPLDSEARCSAAHVIRSDRWRRRYGWVCVPAAFLFGSLNPLTWTAAWHCRSINKPSLRSVLRLCTVNIYLKYLSNNMGRRKKPLSPLWKVDVSPLSLLILFSFQTWRPVFIFVYHFSTRYSYIEQPTFVDWLSNREQQSFCELKHLSRKKADTDAFRTDYKAPCVLFLSGGNKSKVVWYRTSANSCFNLKEFLRSCTHIAGHSCRIYTNISSCLKAFKMGLSFSHLHPCECVTLLCSSARLRFGKFGGVFLLLFAF